jgi:probable phosphoglycerate mutase
VSARRIVLLRHGRSTSNAEGRFQGHEDVPLDALGHAQARAAAAALAEHLAKEAARGAVRVVASDLARARQTAQPVATVLGIDLEEDAALRERYAGAWQGLFREQIAERFPQEFAAWIAGRDVPIGGGESLSQAWSRVEHALRRHAAVTDDDAALVIVGHGTSMRGGMLRLVGLLDGGVQDPNRYRMVGPFGNCHWAELSRSGPDGAPVWALSRYNVPPPVLEASAVLRPS